MNNGIAEVDREGVGADDAQRRAHPHAPSQRVPPPSATLPSPTPRTPMLLLALVARVYAEGLPAPICPFLAGPDLIESGLLLNSLVVDLDPRGSEVIDGLYLAQGPEQLVPLGPWRGVVRWQQGAILFVDDPVGMRPLDLDAAVAKSAAQRFGSAFVGVSQPLPTTLPGISGSLLVGSLDAESWGAAGLVVMPDGRTYSVAASLRAPLSEDPICRAAAITRLGGVRPGPGTRSLEPMTLPLALAPGGQLDLVVPKGFAPHILGSMEAAIYRVVRLGPLDESSDLFAFSLSYIQSNSVSQEGEPVVAHAKVLGTPATWTRSAPDVEQAIVPGVFGTERKGAIRVEVRAHTRGARAKLRKLAERCVLKVVVDPGAADPGVRVYTGTLDPEGTPD